jgi:hypothetical protein
LKVLSEPGARYERLVKGGLMSPVVVVGFGALDAALVSQAIYAYRDFRRAAERAERAERLRGGTARPRR